MRKLNFLLIVFILFLSGCAKITGSSNRPAERSVTVCAAASLKDPLTKIQPLFEEKKNTKLVLNFASSGTLQKQIEEGASADLFISAGKNQMDELEKEKLIDKDTRKDILQNRLVLVVSNDYKNKIKNISDLKNLKVRVSIGEIKTVPAGLYAAESLNSLGMWDELKENIIYGKDVKQVLTYVENGDVGAGIVYLTDAADLKNSFICQVFDDDIHSPIVYPAAIISGSKNKASAKDFLNYLKGEDSLDIFEQYGFREAAD